MVDGVNTNSMEHIETDEILIDGNDSGDIGNLVLKDREMIGENGIVIISCTLDKETKKIVGEKTGYTWFLTKKVQKTRK